MQLDDKLYEQFLKEMQSLEKFRAEYRDIHPAIPLERDDPDVRRLIEAMAVFSARANMAGRTQIDQLYYRMFRELCPFLLSPLPAMGLICISPNSKLAEKAPIEKNCAVVISDEDGESAIFRTLFGVNVLPIRSDGADYINLPEKTCEMTLDFAAPFPLAEQVGAFNLYLNYLDDYTRSLGLRDFLQSHLQKISVVFDGGELQNCSYSFGLPGQDETAIHPIEKVRRFFHFPQQDLYLNIEIPEQIQPWQRFRLVLELDCPWPQGIIFSDDLFRPYVLPVENIRIENAAPINADGIQTRYLVFPPITEPDLAVQSIRGVYRTEGKSVVAMHPGILSGDSGTYELEAQTTPDGRRQTWLKLNLPEAFQNPVPLVVDAAWHNPRFSDSLWQKLSALPFEISIPGLDWGVEGRMVRAAESVLAEDPSSWLGLSALRNKPTLKKDELLTILDALSSAWSREFRAVKKLIADVSARKNIFLQNGLPAGEKWHYQLDLNPLKTLEKPLVLAFLNQLEAILNAWIAFAPVEVSARVGEEKLEKRREKSEERKDR